MADEFLQGAQIGLGIAQQWAARSAREQQLRVEDAYRRMQERQLAAQAEERNAHTLILNQQAKRAVEEDSAMKQGQIDMATAVDLGVPVDQAFLQHMAPAVVRFYPEKAQSLVFDAAVMPYRIEAEKALAEQRQASAGLSRARTAEQETVNWLGEGNEGPKAFAPSNTERIIKEAGARGIKFTQAELDEAFKVAAGVQPRERMAAPPISKPDFISKHLESALKAETENPTGASGGGITLPNALGGKSFFQSPTPKSRDAVIKELGDLYDTIYVNHAESATTATPAIQSAPLDPKARTTGAVYETPKGPLKWTGTGWVTP
jgi:hypothetical protein